MGILDDAIRQHLDLKRERGATESELKQLEDEAFGPPSRPGEPDFPAEEAQEQNGNGAAAAVSEPPQAPPAPEQPAEPSSQAEPSASEHPVVEPPPEVHEPPAEEVPPEPNAAEPSPESEELTAIYDQTSDRFEPEEVDVEDPEPEPEPPVEALDTVEHSLPEEAIEADEEPPEEPAHEPEAEAVPAVEEHEEAPSEEAPLPDQEGGEEEGDDVLADTPEFLKDAPEDDELWFEQGEPKDFDF